MTRRRVTRLRSRSRTPSRSRCGWRMPRGRALERVGQAACHGQEQRLEITRDGRTLGRVRGCLHGARNFGAALLAVLGSACLVLVGGGGAGRSASGPAALALDRDDARDRYRQSERARAAGPPPEGGARAARRVGQRHGAAHRTTDARPTRVARRRVPRSAQPAGAAAGRDRDPARRGPRPRCSTPWSAR